MKNPRVEACVSGFLKDLEELVATYAISAIEAAFSQELVVGHPIEATESDAPLPALAVPIDAALEVPSLLVATTSLPWRRLRIPLRPIHLSHETHEARGRISVGGADGDVPIAGMERIEMLETIDGAWSTSAVAVFSPPSASLRPLLDYASFKTGTFSLTLLPPTPEALGIPPDYDCLLVPRTTHPSLLVRSGYAPIVGRKFPLIGKEISIGGALASSVPLFRLPCPTVARLARGRGMNGRNSYHVKAMDDRWPVRIEGPLADGMVLTYGASLWIEEWHFVLVPGDCA